MHINQYVTPNCQCPSLPLNVQVNFENKIFRFLFRKMTKKLWLNVSEYKSHLYFTPHISFNSIYATPKPSGFHYRMHRIRYSWYFQSHRTPPVCSYLLLIFNNRTQLPAGLTYNRKPYAYLNLTPSTNRLGKHLQLEIGRNEFILNKLLCRIEIFLKKWHFRQLLPETMYPHI